METRVKSIGKPGGSRDLFDSDASAGSEGGPRRLKYVKIKMHESLKVDYLFIPTRVGACW